MKVRSFVKYLILCLLLVACSTPRPQGKTEAEILFKEAELLKEDGHYILATEKLNLIRSQFPYSYYATHAELLQADILYMQENYIESAAAYILFKDFHPKFKKNDYVVMRIADSFYNQLPDTFDRDLSPSYEAIKYYEEVIRLYPKSENAAKSKEKIQRCKELLAKKDRYIADFYYKTEVFDSARHRYLYILGNNLTDKDLRDYYIVRLVKSSENLKDKKTCLNHYEKFKSTISKGKLNELESVANDCRNIENIQEGENS